MPVRPHRGFLSANRRLLALGAIAASGLLTSIPSLPAQADAFVGADAVVEPAQTFTAPQGAALTAVRDSFGVTTFSVIQFPVGKSTPVSSGFGYRECDGCTTNHTGMDFNPGAGFGIEAIAKGVVTQAGWDDTGYGNMVTIEHTINGKKVSSVYAHMQDGSITVKVGDKVKRGEKIGKVGETGEATGPHLHFEIILDGVKVDPAPWLADNVNA